MSEVTHYRITGVNKFDMHELKADPVFTITEAKLDQKAQGEPVTFTLVIAVTAITALAAFLLKKNDSEEFEETIEEMHADGTTKTRRIRYKKSSTEAPNASVIREIRGGN